MEKIQEISIGKAASINSSDDAYPRGDNCGFYYDEEAELYVLYEVKTFEGEPNVSKPIIKHFVEIEIEVENYSIRLDETEATEFDEEDAVEWFEETTRGSDFLADDEDSSDVSLSLIEPDSVDFDMGNELRVRLDTSMMTAEYILHTEPLVYTEAEQVYEKLETGSN
jgi:hypothetical protein